MKCNQAQSRGQKNKNRSVYLKTKVQANKRQWTEVLPSWV